MKSVEVQICELCERHPSVKKVTLFGSRARGDNTDRSDYDIAVYFKENRDESFLLDLEDIETLLQIDVTVMSDQLGERFLQNVKNEEVVIYMTKFENKRENFEKALAKLAEIPQQKETADPILQEIMRDSMIQRFEFCYELAWKTLRAYMMENGLAPDSMPRPTFKMAYQNGIIDNEETWLSMIKDRNVASHQYNEDYIILVAERIQSEYIPALLALKEKFTAYTD